MALYVTTDYGNGSILYVTQTQLEFCFDTKLYSNSSGLILRDSAVIGASYFSHNKGSETN